MGNFDDHFRSTLTRQSWCFYSVGMIMIATRLYSRAKKLGVTNYQIDDHLMILAGGLYTALIATLNTIADGGGSNLYPPELAGTFSEEDIQERIYGSKVVIVSEQAMLNVIYVLKTCMLIMFSRLTLGLQRDQRLVIWLACYVAAGWLASEITFFAACQPFSGYWALPPPDPQCTTLEHYAIVQGCFNISADVLMLGIPIPLIIRMRLPWRQKIVLTVVFSLGVFVILAALMTKIFNLTDVYNPAYMLWYVREASVAVYVSNLPMIWPLLREWFPCLRKLVPGVASRQARYSDNNDNNNYNSRASQWLGRGFRPAGRRSSLRLDVGTQGTLGSRKSTHSTPTTAGTTSHSVLGVPRPSEEGGGVSLSPPSSAQMRGIKAESFFLYYDDLELGLTDLEDDDDDRRALSDEKLARARRFSMLSSGACSSSRRALSQQPPGLEEVLLASEAGLHAAVVYLDAPAKVVTKVEAGSRAARVHSAECQFVSVEESPGAAMEDDRFSKNLYPFVQPQPEEGSGRGDGPRVQTTFERRQEAEEEAEVVSPRTRTVSLRNEETGIAL